MPKHIDSSSGGLTPRSGKPHSNVPPEHPELSRRGFLDTALLAAAAAWLVPCPRLRADDGIVGVIKNAAATGAITVQPLRGNVSVILGSGGNIAVLSGPDGKLLVDAGIAVSQRKITDALASRLGLGPERVVSTIADTGNSSAGTIPYALSVAHEEGRVKDGSIVLMSGFGAGMTWASAVVRWSGGPS